MPSIGFDSKDFKREKIVEEEKKIAFYSPMGVGVKTNDLTRLHEEIAKETLELNRSFNLEKSPPIHCSSSLVQEIGHRRAIPFFDQLVRKLEGFIDSVFISYVVLPPKEVPTVEVGGYNCPRVKIETRGFLRALAPSFSYLTAWSYCGRHRGHNCDMLIDSFSGRETTAWDDLKQYNFKVFSRGDECNALISLADMLAYLTDKKLWDNKKWLLPDAIEEIWDSYDFGVEPRFIDKKILSKIQWYSNEQIAVDPFLAHPMIFLDFEQINMKKFIRFGLYRELTSYAFNKGGGLQGFDVNMDSKKIRDGDIYVYAGQSAHNRADVFNDMYDIEVYSIKELRKKISGIYSP